MTRTQEFIKKYKKVLTSGSDFFNPDTSLMPVEAYEKAKCRILLILPTPHVVKTVSSTVAAINDFVINHCPDTFLDVAYMPENEDIKRYDEWNVPYAIGNITHLDPSHFDIVGFSISVLHEVVTAPVIMSTFNRCDKPIPLFWSQRKDCKLGEHPIIYAGGITATCGESMFGKVKVNGKEEEAYIDFLYLGDCGHTHHLTNRFISAISSGIVHRSQEDRDVPGYPHQEWEPFTSEVAVSTIQEYIDSLFDLEEIYQPQAYEVAYNSHNQIVKNVKVNPKARDYVHPYYPHIMAEDLGIGRTVIPANGDNVGVTQVQASEGCSAGGQCSFMVTENTRVNTSEGLIAIKEAAERGLREVSAVTGIEPCKDIKSQTKGRVWRVTTSNGHVLECDIDHIMFVVQDNKLVEKKLAECTPGDVILRSLQPTLVKDTFIKDQEFAEFLGFMHGDGCMSDKRWQMFCDEGEYKHYHSLFKKFIPTKSQSCIAYQSPNSTIYEISGNPVDFGFDVAAVTCKDLYVPECIFKSSDSIIASYLRGVFQADGWFNDTLGLTSISEGFIRDVAQLLAVLGIDTVIHNNPYFARHKVGGHNPSWYITIPKAFQSKFIELVGFHDKNHQVGPVLNRTKANITLSESDILHFREIVPTPWKNKDVSQLVDLRGQKITDEYLRNHSEYFTDNSPAALVASGRFVSDSIAAIEPTDRVELMYDVVETTSHSCVYGGFLTHQCSEGAYTGGWVEKSKERIQKEMWESKKYSAAYKMKPFSFNCVQENTLVYTNRGFVRAKDIANSPIMGVYAFTNHEGISTSEQPVIHVNLEQGSGITLTPHHRQTVLTAQGLTEVKACELRPGTWVPQRIGYTSAKAVEGSFEHVLGYWYGDGFYGGNSAYLYVNKDEESEISSILKSEWIAKQCTDRSDGLSVYLLTKEFTKRCKEICPSKDTFDILTLGATECILSFVRGLFDADGCGSNGKLKITQKESRLSILNDIQVVLGAVGIRTHITPSIEVTLNDKVYHRRDVHVVGRESRDLWLSLIGSSISHKTTSVRASKTKWSDKDKCLPGLFGVWTYNELCAIDAQSGHNASKFFKGIKGITVDRYIQLFGDYDIEPVRLVKAGVRFTEVTSVYDAGISTVVDVTETTTGRWIANGYITHNTNYITDYKGQLGEWIKIFPKVTFLNMRMEELGMDPDALKMMKQVGSNRLSCPLEGMSPRIMNNLLNKCLSEEAIDNVMSYCVHGKMTDVKIGGIFTSFEQDEDYQWICDFFDKYNDKAAQEGGNFTGRLKFTPLVHYTLTTLEYLERKSAKNSFFGNRWLSDEWYEKFKEHRISFKVNGFRYSTFLEQTFVDLGRSLTPLVYKHFVSQSAPVYSLRSCATEEYISELKSIIDADVYFNDRDIDHYISPCHRVHIDLMGSYIPRARRLLRAKQAGNIFDNPPDERCLLTRVGAKVRCYHSCAVKEPLKIYKDVVMDKDGNLHGEYTDLTGCQRCPTPEHRKARLARPIISSMDSDKLIAVPRMAQVQKIRFVLRRIPEYDCLNPHNTAHTFITKFLQLSDGLLHAYHSIVCHNMFWQCGPNFKFFTAGYQVVDTMWSKNVIKEVKDLIPEVNKHLKSVQVVSAQDVLRDEKIAITDINFYTFESTLPRELFDAAGHTYKGQIKVEAQVQGFALTETVDSSLEKPVFASKGGKTIGAFWIPAKYNPVMFLAGYLSQAKKTSEDGVVTTTEFSCVMTMRENKLACKLCGKEKGLISVTTGKALTVGKSCACKALLTKMVKS